ncbi:MotE family protein [Devosia lacusdianchii]|uniref:MotE family protein n=1 Tax=Devosia lacusdianchii TaxID=2917991 RepID=UPI001F05C09F|nr:hypothetical protein [Devosia sp. JXJ CY 41]
MKNIRLLPVVILAVAALLVLKTVGLVTNGGYALTGVTVARAAGGTPAAPAEGAEAGGDPTLPNEATMEDTSPTLADPAPTLAPQTAPEAGAAPGGGHGAPAAEAAAPAATEGEAAAEHPATPVAVSTSGTYCIEADATIQEDGAVVMAAGAQVAGDGHGEAASAETTEAAPAPAPEPTFAESMTDCLPSGDAVPVEIDGKGGSVPLITADGTTLSEQQLLERLATRRTQLEQYEQDLALRASIVDAAEKRIEERAATLAALEAQISTLVDQRQEMESGQFAGIVAMYETMKPKDAANIFNNLDMAVLLQVAKLMSPRKMAPILAEMEAARAQELTVKMAALSDQPATEMTPDDLAALPQIVGQ